MSAHLIRPVGNRDGLAMPPLSLVPLVIVPLCVITYLVIYLRLHESRR
ncbi:MAG: hypothetical protein R3308_11025 [Thiohalobacterales bacterium]|nr:hypothetical protein [Thiohalobacterales bacterium]